jgi:succinylarginine dihydrolase
MPEVSFNGLVGPTHNYGGLSAGNVASMSHGGRPSSPRQGALQSLDKTRALRELGVTQGVLPPHPRPSLSFLRGVGFTGTDEEVLAAAGGDDGHLLRVASSAAAMWTANAATVAPSADTRDGRVHLVTANLDHMLHRALEAETTHSVLSAIFRDEARFAVHAPLPGGGQLADEGAANHSRLYTPGMPAAHVFAWGRAHFRSAPLPTRFPARQTEEASRALARLLQVDPDRALFPQQDPAGIDGGAFHTDVLGVGNEDALLVHERAFSALDELLERLHELVPTLAVCRATEAELPVEDAVAAYPFNSQLVTRGDGKMAIIAPVDAEENPRARAYLERAVSELERVDEVRYLDVRQSMRNGGGPACLRLRVALTDEEVGGLCARVILDDALEASLRSWVERRYRDRLVPADLRDPLLHREQMEALDELSQLLELGSVYDFQREGMGR